MRRLLWGRKALRWLKELAVRWRRKLAHTLRLLAERVDVPDWSIPKREEYKVRPDEHGRPELVLAEEPEPVIATPFCLDELSHEELIIHGKKLGVKGLQKQMRRDTILKRIKSACETQRSGSVRAGVRAR
jgi:hypothetical protein